MAERKVKSLGRTGRVSRARARSVAIALQSCSLPAGPEMVVKRTTASGQKKIAFADTKPPGVKKSTQAKRKAARKRS